MERRAEGGEERATGLYTPRTRQTKPSNITSSLIAPRSFARSRASSTFRTRIQQKSPSSHFALGNPRLTFPHALLPPFSRPAAPRKPNRVGLVSHPHSPARRTRSRCRLQNLCTSNAGPLNPSLTTNSPPTVVWRLPSPALVHMTLRARDR